MKHDIKFIGTTESLCAANMKLGIDSSKIGKETRDFDMPGLDIDARERDAILRTRMDRIVSRVTADIEQLSAGEFCKGNSRFDKAELVQRTLIERSKSFEVLCRNSVTKINSN